MFYDPEKKVRSMFIKDWRGYSLEGGILSSFDLLTGPVRTFHLHNFFFENKTLKRAAIIGMGIESKRNEMIVP